MRAALFRIGMVVNHVTHGRAVVLAVDTDSEVVVIALKERGYPYRASPHYLTIVGMPSLTERPPAKRYGPFKPIPKALP